MKSLFISVLGFSLLLESINSKFFLQEDKFGLPDCSKDYIQPQCFKQICNPIWFHFPDGCQVNLRTRLDKSINLNDVINNHLVYFMATDREAYENTYMTSIAQLTAFNTKKVFTYLFQKDQYQDLYYELPTLNNTLTRVLEIFEKLGFTNDFDIIDRVDSQLKSIKGKNSPQLVLFMVLIKSVKDLLHEIQERLKKSYSQESIEIDMDVLNEKIEDIKAILMDSNGDLAQYPFYSYQLLANFAFAYFNSKALIAFGQDDVNDQFTYYSDFVRSQSDFKSKLIQYSQSATQYRLKFISDKIQCNATNETKDNINTYYTTYYWNDTYSDISVEEQVKLYSESWTFINMCIIDQEKTDGSQLSQELEQYKLKAQAMITNYYQAFIDAFNSISTYNNLKKPDISEY